MTETIPELLPLGTAVKIKGDDSLYIIISRGFQKNGEEMIAGYAGVPHPYGESKKYKTVTIATKDILEVVHRGYEDELDKSFIQEQLGKAPEAPEPLVKPEEEIVNVIGKVETPAESQVVSEKPPEEKKFEYPHDPFYNLKHKTKENKK
jgi:hypothetical protein